MIKSETRQFRMHPKLLFDVIQRQAGTLAKGIVEGVMNAVDAKATKCDITLVNHKLTITDNGCGILTREHVEKFFETFGQPHTEDEAKVFGTFRMGRGQLFSFGVNRWRTGPWEMVVDIKHKGLDYELFEHPKATPGCKIEIQLYEDLLPSDLADTEEMIRNWCKYAPIELCLNKDQIFIKPETEKWDHILDEAYVRLKPTGNLSVYNLGVHTLDLPVTRYGTGGIIVSRRQLQVNFARNDIQRSCPVWKKLAPLVNKYATQNNLKKPSLTDAERGRLCSQVSRGELPASEVGELRIFTAVNGRHFSLRQLGDRSYGYNLSNCPAGDRLGDKLFQQKTAFILADETLERFGVPDVGTLLKRLLKHCEPYTYGVRYVKYVPFVVLSEGLDDQFEIIPDKDHTVSERLWMYVLNGHKFKLQLSTETGDDWAAHCKRAATRRLLIGDSQCNDGWTDGETYVAINRGFLAKQQLDLNGITELGLLLLHEFCHDSADTEKHIHSHEFYESFHESCRSLGRFVEAVVRNVPQAAKAVGRKLTKRQLAQQDQLAKHDRSLQELCSQTEAAARPLS